MAGKLGPFGTFGHDFYREKGSLLHEQWLPYGSFVDVSKLGILFGAGELL